MRTISRRLGTFLREKLQETLRTISCQRAHSLVLEGIQSKDSATRRNTIATAPSFSSRPGTLFVLIMSQKRFAHSNMQNHRFLGDHTGGTFRFTMQIGVPRGREVQVHKIVKFSAMHFVCVAWPRRAGNTQPGLCLEIYLYCVLLLMLESLLSSSNARPTKAA